MARLVVAVILLLLAGCARPAPDGTATQDASHPSLQGVVTDPAVRPIAGAVVHILGTDLSVTTATDGTFAFTDPLDPGQGVVLVVSRDGYASSSLQTSLDPAAPTFVRIVLTLLPSSSGYHEVLKFKGLIGCQVAVALGEGDASGVDCGQQVDSGQTNWVFPVGPALVTAIVEVVWTPTQPFAQGLGGRLEQTRSDGTHVLAEKVARSPLRLAVPQETARQEFKDGGSLRLVVSAQPITDEDEQAIAAGLGVDQSFEAFASLFYGVPPDPSYSVTTS
jgi:hypothetical protein